MAERAAGGRPRLGSAAALAIAASAALAAVGALGGCQLAPPHVRPELPTAAVYPPEYAGDTAAGRAAPELPWREFFADPRLEALLEASLARNRDLVAALAAVEEVRGLYRIQRADRFPAVGLSADRSRSRSDAGTLGAGAAVATGARVDRYSIGVGFSSFELDFFGRVRNLTEAARAQYLATAEGARAFRLTLLREVAFVYLLSLESTERIALAEATVASREQQLDIARRRLGAGVTSALEYQQSETLLTQAQIELAALRLARAQNDNTLAVLVGGPLASALPDAAPLGAQVENAVLAAGLPSELLAARPDILAAEERLRAARADIGAARAAFWPSISLTGTRGYTSTELENLVGEDGNTWSFGPALTLPIFDFGRRRGNVAAARAREAQAVADYELTIQTAFREVADALAGRRFLAEQVAAQERGTRAQRRLAELAQQRYLEGVVSYLEVLDAERNLFAAEQALLQTRRLEVANLVDLYIALGGGVRGE